MILLRLVWWSKQMGRQSKASMTFILQCSLLHELPDWPQNTREAFHHQKCIALWIIQKVQNSPCKIHSGLNRDTWITESTYFPRRWSEPKGTGDFRFQLDRGSSWYKWYTYLDWDPLKDGSFQVLDSSTFRDSIVYLVTNVFERAFFCWPLHNAIFLSWYSWPRLCYMMRDPSPSRAIPSIHICGGYY